MSALVCSCIKFATYCVFPNFSSLVLSISSAKIVTLLPSFLAFNKFSVVLLLLLLFEFVIKIAPITTAIITITVIIPMANFLISF